MERGGGRENERTGDRSEERVWVGVHSNYRHCSDIIFNVKSHIYIRKHSGCE